MDNNQSDQLPPESVASTTPISMATAATSRKKNPLMLIVAILLALAIAGGGVYFWQNKKTEDANTKLKSTAAEVTTLKTSNEQLQKDLAEAKSQPASASTTPAADATKPATTSDINSDLYPGQADISRPDGKIFLNASFKRSLNPGAIWAEYGASPTELTKSTTHYTDGLAEGDATTYVHGYSLQVPASSVSPGTTYFYRIAATIGGKTVYGPVATFTTTK